MRIRYTTFMSFAGGGYGRTFEAVDYPGIVGSIQRKNRKAKEERSIVYKDKTFTKAEDAINAWKADHPEGVKNET